MEPALEREPVGREKPFWIRAAEDKPPDVTDAMRCRSPWHMDML